MLWFPCTLLALFASAQGRAVNISNTWVLPEEGFPVFYRYFRDRISWYEADAVCQFHHANLVTVDTTAQYDAVRAYLKELDISSAVWVGLIRSNPDGDFTWTDYRGLSSEGYWSSAPDARAAPLCAAADPAADYRWEARACGGPTVASFICELPVPQWALGNDGCMVRALPALTVLYLPESAAVQLTADCGLAGVKRVQCTGNVKREELLKELSCNDEEDVSSTLSVTSTSTMWSVTDTPITDQESTTDEQSSQDTTITDYKETSNTDPHVTETSTPYNLNIKSDIRKIKQPLNTQYITKSLNEELNLDQSHNDNIVSNDIPHQDNAINHPNIDKLEENKSLKHRLLHDEMTRLEKLKSMFTQPTDHFVPPLVMAKARISDDMTVLSLKEKHAQQIAEQQLLKHTIFVEHLNITPSETSNQDSQGNSNIVTPIKIDEHEQATSPPINQNGNIIKKDVKSSVPKKYINKYNNLKGKIWRTIDSKINKSEMTNGLSTLESSSKTSIIEITTPKIQTNSQKKSEEDSIMDLTVIIKEPGDENIKKIFYSNHSDSVSKVNLIKNVTAISEKVIQSSLTTEKPAFFTNPTTEESISKVTLNHEVIKITLINDNASNSKSPPVVFEISTMVPVLNNDSIEIKDTSTSTTSVHSSSQISNVNSSAHSMVTEMSSAGTQKREFEPVTVPINEKHIASEPSEIDELAEPIAASTKIFTTTIETNTNNENKMADAVTTATITASVGEHISVISVIPEKSDETSTSNAPNVTEITVAEKVDIFNHTEHDEEQENHESDMIDDYQSPLLSAANEPLHRPSRSRRPQPPRTNKFNPFRILG